MTRALTWASFVWDQAFIKYVRLLHTKLLSRRSMWLSIALGVAVAAVFGHTIGVAAQETSVGRYVALGVTGAACIAMGPGCIVMILTLIIIAAFLLIVVNMLFGVAQLLTWILVKAAAYNNFVNATAVTLGWTLVRDVVNMFFIIVLLIIAFSTIIGYKEFHYKAYLPKLLLMAVLINFSRTLVGVLIDFSQVITLTFVNGFKDAAFGNFAKAFGISGLLKAAGNASGIGDVGSLIIAIIFAVMILTVACTTLTILMLYFIIRIIMLWVLLILSPIAFFATALPGKMQKALSQVSSDWWSKLSTWLTGGPIVAFFLWLSLAVVQQGTNEFSKMAGPTSDAEKAAFSATITEIGNPDNIGLLIVSVALMLIGVQTAVSVSQQANPALGAFAAKIKQGGVNAPARFVARTAGRAAGRAAAPAVGAVAGRAGARFQGLATKAGRIPVVGGIAAAGLTQVSGYAKGIKKGIGTAAQKRAEATLEGHNTGDQLKSIDAILGGKGLTDIERAGYERKRATLLTKGAGQKAVAKQAEDEVRAQNAALPAGQQMSEDQIKAKAADVSKMRIQGILAAAKKSSQENDDEELEKQVDETYKKNPSLIQSAKGVKDAVSSTDVKEMVSDAMRDELVAAAVLLKHNVANEGGLVGTEQETLDAEPIKEILKQGGDKANFLRAAVRDFSSGDGKARLGSLVQAMNNDTDPGANRLQMSKGTDADGRPQILFAQSSLSPEGRPPMNASQFAGGPRRVSSAEELVHELPPAAQAQARSALSSLGASHTAFNGPLNGAQANSLHEVAGIYGSPAPAGGYSDVQRADMAVAQTAGVPSSVALNYDSSANAFRSPASRTAAEQTYSDLLEHGADTGEAAGFIANTDVEALKKGGEMRDVVAKAFKEHAGKINDMLKDVTEEQGKKLQAIFKTLSSQAEAIVNRGGATTQGERDLVEFRSKIGGKALRNLGGAGQKKKT